MNNKEAEDIGYEIYRFFKDTDELSGVDAAMEIANQASDVFHRLLSDHPKIKEKYLWWKTRVISI